MARMNSEAKITEDMMSEYRYVLQIRLRRTTSLSEAMDLSRFSIK